MLNAESQFSVKPFVFTRLNSENLNDIKFVKQVIWMTDNSFPTIV